MTTIYLTGSLRNPEVPKVGAYLRGLGFDVFDDWFAAGSIADEAWRDYELSRGHDLSAALAGLAAEHVFNFDKTHLDRADIGVLMVPAGRSAHLELGYLIGQNKPGFILLDQQPERFDVMYKLAEAVITTKEQLAEWLLAYSRLSIR